MKKNNKRSYTKKNRKIKKHSLKQKGGVIPIIGNVLLNRQRVRQDNDQDPSEHSYLLYLTEQGRNSTQYARSMVIKIFNVQDSVYNSLGTIYIPGQQNFPDCTITAMQILGIVDEYTADIMRTWTNNGEASGVSLDLVLKWLYMASYRNQIPQYNVNSSSVVPFYRKVQKSIASNINEFYDFASISYFSNDQKYKIAVLHKPSGQLRYFSDIDMETFFAGGRSEDYLMEPVNTVAQYFLWLDIIESQLPPYVSGSSDQPAIFAGWNNFDKGTYNGGGHVLIFARGKDNIIYVLDPHVNKNPIPIYLIDPRYSDVTYNALFNKPSGTKSRFYEDMNLKYTSIKNGPILESEQDPRYIDFSKLSMPSDEVLYGCQDDMCVFLPMPHSDCPTKKEREDIFSQQVDNNLISSLFKGVGRSYYITCVNKEKFTPDQQNKKNFEYIFKEMGLQKSMPLLR